MSANNVAYRNLSSNLGITKANSVNACKNANPMAVLSLYLIISSYPATVSVPAKLDEHRKATNEIASKQIPVSIIWPLFVRLTLLSMVSLIFLIWLNESGLKIIAKSNTSHSYAAAKAPCKPWATA